MIYRNIETGFQFESDSVINAPGWETVPGKEAEKEEKKKPVRKPRKTAVKE